MRLHWSSVFNVCKRSRVMLKSPSIYHKQVQDDSTRFESQPNNRLTCETRAQILVWGLFFEFHGLVWITTSNLGTSSIGEFPGLNEMGVFPHKQDFKGFVLGRKVRLDANMYSFNNIYLFFASSALKASFCLDQKLNLLTMENSTAWFDFFKETFLLFPQVNKLNNIVATSDVWLKCLVIERTSYC